MSKRFNTKRVALCGLLLSALVSVVFAVIGMTTCRDVFVFFGAQGEALKHVRDYMDIWYFGCFSAALSMAGNSLLIGVGDNKAASFSMMGGMIIPPVEATASIAPASSGA